MARYPYRILKNAFDRVFRNDLNKNFEDIEADIKSQKNRVDNLINEVEQPSEVVDARVDADGHVYPVLKERLDTEQHNTETELLNHEDRIQQNSEDISVNAQKIYMTNQNLDNLISRIGNNEDLNTTQKATLILAINEINSKANSNESSINDINDSISQLADMISGLGNDLTAHEGKTALNDVHGLLSGGHIIEDSGRNENGTYIRYSNGFQICFFSESSYTSVDGNSVYNADYVFPASFVSASTVVGTIDSTSFVTNTFWRVANRTNTSFRFTIFNESASVRNITFNYIALGRWK